jgi:U6 snRNA-associated Sm-like protein LSm6
MENGTALQSEGRDPSSFLSEIIGSQVTVKLNSGVVYKGQLLACISTLTISLICGPRRVTISRWVHEHRAGEN